MLVRECWSAAKVETLHLATNIRFCALRLATVEKGRVIYTQLPNVDKENLLWPSQWFRVGIVVTGWAMSGAGEEWKRQSGRDTSSR